MIKLLRVLPFLFLTLVYFICTKVDANEIIVSSNYISDGVSQTDNQASLQISYDFMIESFYSNVFLSNIKLEQDTGLAMNLSIGKLVEKDKFTLDFGLTNNTVNSIDNTDSYFLELYTGFNFNTASIYIMYADDEKTFDGGNNIKFIFSDAYSINSEIQFNYQLGYADMFKSKLTNSDYYWWQIGLDYTKAQHKLSVNYSNTDIQSINDPSNIAQDQLFLTYSYLFGK